MTQPDLGAIKARLLRAGYPPPGREPQAPPQRAVSREAQAARAELREHIIADIWALVAALEERSPREPGNRTG